MTRLIRTFALPCLAFALLAGCAAAPTKEEIAQADYGRDMTQAECVAVAEKVLADSMRDPGSAQFRHGTCTQGFWGSVPILGMGKRFGWFLKGELNGKNAFGGYVGFRPYQVLMRDGQVVRYCTTDRDGFCMPVGQK